MSKWYDANGTDVDAYPDRVFKDGVYSLNRTSGGTMVLNRQNPMGLRFTLTEKGNQTVIHLVGSEKEITVNFPLEKISAMWYKWQMQGEFIQNAFAGFTPDEREFLMIQSYRGILGT